MSIVVASYGGGVNSTAMLIGMAERQEHVDLILFADTGGEKPETYSYVRRFAHWLVNHGMPPIQGHEGPRPADLLRGTGRQRELKAKGHALGRGAPNPAPGLHGEARKPPPHARGRQECAMNGKTTRSRKNQGGSRKVQRQTEAEKPLPSLVQGRSRRGKLYWRVHTPGLLQEILNNNETAILLRPVQIFALLLHAVAERAAKINDAELNRLMLRLTLYEIADPNSQKYNAKAVDRWLREAK